jgi:cold shock protein
LRTFRLRSLRRKRCLHVTGTDQRYPDDSGHSKFFSATKGFGFIEPNDGSKDAFVHISAVEQAGLSGLAEGQKVTYELENGRDGKISASNLHRI